MVEYLIHHEDLIKSNDPIYELCRLFFYHLICSRREAVPLFYRHKSRKYALCSLLPHHVGVCINVWIIQQLWGYGQVTFKVYPLCLFSKCECFLNLCIETQTIKKSVYMKDTKFNICMIYSLHCCGLDLSNVCRSDVRIELRWPWKWIIHKKRTSAFNSCSS